MMWGELVGGLCGLDRHGEVEMGGVAAEVRGPSEKPDAVVPSLQDVHGLDYVCSPLAVGFEEG